MCTTSLPVPVGAFNAILGLVAGFGKLCHTVVVPLLQVFNGSVFELVGEKQAASQRGEEARVDRYEDKRDSQTGRDIRKREG